MTPEIPERRRTQRATVGPGSWLAVPATWPVQVIDVSMGGLAFSSPYALEIGRTASVRAPLGRDALNCQVRVCWSRSRDPVGSIELQFEVGAAFLPLDDSSRRVLESFLKLSSPE